GTVHQRLIADKSIPKVHRYHAIPAPIVHLSRPQTGTNIHHINPRIFPLSPAPTAVLFNPMSFS
ncbi:MAG: hypothetical protein LBK65_04015, partial [Tannerellaceae bacterium]|nr:hypothetical protein [Tannerellaceae bacterium]